MQPLDPTTPIPKAHPQVKILCFRCTKPFKIGDSLRSEALLENILMAGWTCSLCGDCMVAVFGGSKN